MPWEESQDYIHSGHRRPEEFQEGSLRTITFSEEEGIKAVIGKPKGKDTTEVQSYLFDKDKWSLEKAKAWFEEHRESKVKEHVSAILPFKVLEKIVDKPLRIRGIAMTAGMSRNFNIYTPEELPDFTSKLVSAPVYVEHIINQFYLGCETPLPRLFSTPGFTEASANAALDLQNMLIKPIQRYIKRQVEREIFASVLKQAGLDLAKAKVRLNWGSPKTQEISIADMLKAAELGLIRQEEFRKNAVKFGWELWEQPETSVEGTRE